MKGCRWGLEGRWGERCGRSGKAGEDERGKGGGGRRGVTGSGEGRYEYGDKRRT